MFMGIDGSESEVKVPWDTLARYAAWAYNTSYHAVLRTTPYEIMFGRPPQVHALGALGGDHQITGRIMRIFEDEIPNSDIEPPERKLSADDERLFRIIKLDQEITETLRQNVKKNLMEAQQRWAGSAKIAEDGLTFEPGDYILLRNMRATSNVMIPKYMGPYEVLSRKSPVNYEILRVEPHFADRGYRETVHVDRMKNYYNPVPGKPIVPLFLEPEPSKEEEPEFVDILEITPTGLETVIRMPADSGVPVPMVSQYTQSPLGNIEADISHLTGDAGLQQPHVIDEIGIKSAQEDTLPEPVQLLFKQTGTTTRSKAKRIGMKVAEIYSDIMKRSY
jgi:hypothetical protein